MVLAIPARPLQPQVPEQTGSTGQGADVVPTGGYTEGPGIDTIGSRGVVSMGDIYRRAKRMILTATGAYEEDPRSPGGLVEPPRGRSKRKTARAEVRAAAAATADVVAVPDPGEEVYTRRGPISTRELGMAFMRAEPFVFVRFGGTVRAYSSRDPQVRVPLALAALRLEDVLPLDEDALPVSVGPTLPYWDPRITSNMLQDNLVQMSDEQRAWRRETNVHRRNLWRSRGARVPTMKRLTLVGQPG
jgi:hypothetical protein